MKSLKPNGQRAKNAIIFIWIILVLDVLSLISGYFQYDLLKTVANGGFISPVQATLNDLREQIIAILYLLASIVSAITFIQWFRRAYFNLHLHIEYLLHPEGWAAGSWFVPIVSFYRPYQIMKELYEESIELLEKRGIRVPDISMNYISVWWAFWILSSIFGQVILRITLKSNTVDDYIFTTICSMIQNIVNIPLALLAIQVIKNYAKLEPHLFELKEEEMVKNEVQTFGAEGDLQ
ncbi:MAG: hypothetical protein RLZZ531_1685 [Bacteroidota bacterium]|jgi:hypothetical protein